MASHSTPAGRAAVHCIMAAALCWTAYLNIESPYTRAILNFNASSSDNALAGIDFSVRSATKDGNAVVVFEGFSPDRSKDQGFITRMYFRGNYTAYPRRVFVCDDGQRFDGKQLAAHPFQPDSAWMKEHAIRCVLTFVNVPGHDLRWAVRRI